MTAGDEEGSGVAEEAARDATIHVGPLRAAINLGNKVLAGRDERGELAGVSVDLAREVARQRGAALELLPFDTAAAVVDALKRRSVDFAFLAIDPARAAAVDYTAPYVIIEGAYLVRGASPLARNEDVDRAGNRVVVGAGSAYDLFLARTLKQASIERVPTSAAVVHGFLAGGFEVAAGVRQQLASDASRAGGLRMLPGHFMKIEQAMALPKGNAAFHAWLQGFVEAMKGSGFVARALERHGIEGVEVAPAAN